MKTIPLFSILSSLGLVFGAISCRPLYRSSIPYQPMLTEANEADIKIGLETGTAYTHVSYALTDYFFLTAGGNAWSNRHSTAQFGEVGLGLFTAGEGMGRSIMANVGYGTSTVESLEFPIFIGNDFVPTDVITSQFARFALQPGFYIYNEDIEVSFAARTSMLYWLGTNRPEATASSYDIYLEPVATIRAGSAVTKFFLESSLQLPLYRSFPNANYPLHIGFGINFMLSAKRFTPTTK